MTFGIFGWVSQPLQIFPARGGYCATFGDRMHTSGIWMWNSALRYYYK